VSKEGLIKVVLASIRHEHPMTKLEIATRAKELLVSGLRLEVSAEEIVDAEPIFGAGLGLDSIDALEFVVLVEEEFGVTIPDETVAKRAFASIDALAEFIHVEQQSQAG
jgi:acyl carrier protein